MNHAVEEDGVGGESPRTPKDSGLHPGAQPPTTDRTWERDFQARLGRQKGRLNSAL